MSVPIKPGLGVYVILSSDLEAGVPLSFIVTTPSDGNVFVMVVSEE